jgi:hypothetical protein
MANKHFVGLVIPGLGYEPARQAVQITEVSASSGKWVRGIIACANCMADREIHSGDWFQVRLCVPCTDKARKATRDQKRAQTPKKTPAQLRQAGRARADAKKAHRAAQEAIRAERLATQTREQGQAEEKRRALIAQVAMEKGVKVAS